MFKKTYTEPDQTHFSLEEPIFEEFAELPSEPKAKAEVVQPLLKQKKVVIGLVIGATILVLLLIVMLNALFNRAGTLMENIQPNINSNTTNTGGPIGERLTNLQAELKKADPNKSELTFPSVDFSIKIDEPERR